MSSQRSFWLGSPSLPWGWGCSCWRRPPGRQFITGIRPVAPALGSASDLLVNPPRPLPPRCLDDTGPNDAYFYGSHSGGETITISKLGVVGNITFAGTTYTLTGGTVDFAATSGTSPITTNYNATISSNVIGTVAMTKSSDADLILTGSDTYSGPTTISAAPCNWETAARGDRSTKLQRRHQQRRLYLDRSRQHRLLARHRRQPRPDSSGHRC